MAISTDTSPSRNEPVFHTILFDLDNTLIDRTGAYRRYADDFAARRCEILSAAERCEIVEAMCVHDDSGYRNREEHCRWIAERFRPGGMSAERVWEDYVERIGRFVRPDSKSVSLIARLRQKFRVALVTNGSTRTQKAKMASADLIDAFDAVFISEEIGTEKPAPEIFHHALQWAGCRAGDVLFVGDDPINDIAGASRAGMNTCWISHGRQFPNGLAQPEWIVPSIHEFDAVAL